MLESTVRATATDTSLDGGGVGLLATGSSGAAVVELRDSVQYPRASGQELEPASRVTKVDEEVRRFSTISTPSPIER